MTKIAMLNEMFSDTQYAKHIQSDVNLPKTRIQRVYDYFIAHPEDSKRAQFCSRLLAYKNN